MKKTIDLILKNAQEINALDDELAHAAKNKVSNHQAWLAAAERFNTSYDRLAFPGGLNRGLTLLKKYDSDVIAQAIIYLQADPYFHRSGYIKEQILKILKKASFTKKQIIAMQELIISIIHKGLIQDRTYKQYCTIASKITDDNFCTSIENIVKTASDPRVKESAQLVLQSLLKKSGA